MCVLPCFVSARVLSLVANGQIVCIKNTFLRKISLKIQGVAGMGWRQNIYE
jgi:hypothetical protein